MGGLCSSTAQAPPKEERQFNNTTPKNLPLKIALKNVEKFKDVQNEEWVRDLEIEVENKSNKPIYYLRLFVELSDVTEDNLHLGFPLQYGRGDLVDLALPLQSDDVPLKPGERYIFKVADYLQGGWDSHTARVGMRKSAPRKVSLIFKSLNFGDGTGYLTNSGVPMDIHHPTPLSYCVNKEQQENSLAVLYRPPNPFPDFPQLTTLLLPAEFLPVFFLRA